MTQNRPTEWTETRPGILERWVGHWHYIKTVAGSAVAKMRAAMQESRIKHYAALNQRPGSEKKLIRKKATGNPGGPPTPPQEPSPRTKKSAAEAGLLARVRASLGASATAEHAEVLARLDRLQAESARLQIESTRSLEIAAREREGRAKAEAEVLIRASREKLNDGAAKILASWLAKACADGRVQLTKDDLAGLMAAMPNYGAVFGPAALEQFQRPKTVAKSDRERHEAIARVAAEEHISYPAAFERVTGQSLNVGERGDTDPPEAA